MSAPRSPGPGNPAPGNVEQVEAGLREVTRALLDGNPLDEAFGLWLLPTDADMALPLAVTFRHSAAAFRILVTAGLCPARDVWVHTVSERLAGWIPDGLPGAPVDVDRVVLLCAAEAGGAGLRSIGELPGGPVQLSAVLLALFTTLVEALVVHGLAFDEVFRVALLARRPAVEPDAPAAAAALAGLPLRRL